MSNFVFLTLGSALYRMYVPALYDGVCYIFFPLFLNRILANHIQHYITIVSL